MVISVPAAAAALIWGKCPF